MYPNVNLFCEGWHLLRRKTQSIKYPLAGDLVGVDKKYPAKPLSYFYHLYTAI